MAYAIARIAKLKGGSVASADRHVERQRETPNADKERLAGNVRLVGEDRPLREMVTEMIERHGGRPRRDSVECVELLLGASPEHFNEGRAQDCPARVREFAEKVKEFLGEQYGARCVKALLHRDERTPHVQAFVVPIDERGKLNCKALFGTRQKLREFQNSFAAKMQPLGLERGVEGSRATHTEIARFYSAINREVRLRVAPERVPDPPRVMVTEASRKQYKQQVIRAVTEQLLEPMQTIYEQSLLAREEKGKREAAERRAQEAERRAEQKAKDWARLYLDEQKQNIAFHHETRELRAQLAREQKDKVELTKEVSRLNGRVVAAEGRVRDIPLVEVMRALGYRGEQDGKQTIYRDAHVRAAMTIEGDKAAHGKSVVARNAIDLVRYMRETNERTPTTPDDATRWLAERFGAKRTVAATLVRAEQGAAMNIREQERRRERDTQREAQRQEHERSGCSR